MPVYMQVQAWLPSSSRCRLAQPDHQVPRAPLPASRCTFCGVASSTTSEGITPPSSLIQAHAPDQIPPPGFGYTSSGGSLQVSPVPAGRWPFPTLSLQSLRRCLDPYPVVFCRCTCSFLPSRQRPHVRTKTFGTPNIPAMQLQQGLHFEAAVISLCSGSHVC